MPKTMRAAFLKAPFKTELREVPIPEVKPGWVLVKIEACGICGSDVRTARAAADWTPFGHEIIGVAVQVGAGVSSVSEGDCVALQSGAFCGNCDACRDGRVDLCNAGDTFVGNPARGMAEYILAAEEVVVVYDGLTVEQAALVEPLGVAMDMLLTADLQPTNDLLVVGLGPIGLMCIGLARHMGAGRIYAAHTRPGRRMEVASLLGADEVYCVGDKAIAQYPYRHKGLGGARNKPHVVERALVTAPCSVIPETLDILNYGGILVYIGWADGGTVPLALDAFHLNKSQLRASFASPALYFPMCLQALRDGWVDADALVSHVLPLERIQEGLELLRDDPANTLKVLIKP